jgi:signal peptidase I
LFGERRPYLLAVAAAIIVFILVAPVRVHGGNMSPTLNDGDVVIVLKHSYSDVRPPEYGDVLCFKRSFAPESARGPGGERTYRFARVAGLPGDEIESRDGYIYRSGENSERLAPVVPDGEAVSGGGFAGTRDVGPEDVFVLNDDPNDTLDSRDGAVDAQLGDARGKAVFRIWPLDGFGPVG